MTTTGRRAAVEDLFAAIGSRDLRRIRDRLADDVIWQNVPHPVVAGREAVVAMLADIVTWSDTVRWDIVSAAAAGDHLFVEHTDHFMIDGVDHAVRCNGIIRTAGNVVTSVRDFVDLGEWRSRVGPALAAMAARPAVGVVERHLRGVRALDPVAMAADYAHDAVLVRPGLTSTGRTEIAEYFDTVPDRLAGRPVEVGAVTERADGRVTVDWTIGGSTGASPGATGVDTYEVADGRIRRQVVTLTTSDF